MLTPSSAASTRAKAGAGASGVVIERRPWQRTGPDTRIRGREGQRLRKRRLARTDGCCEMCDAEGRVAPATVVNHKLPLAHGGLDVDENTENLCARHDAIVTAQQFGKRLTVAVDADGWPEQVR
jgi:5-methylcytosine-specific restriction protein A